MTKYEAIKEVKETINGLLWKPCGEDAMTSIAGDYDLDEFHNHLFRLYPAKRSIKLHVALLTILSTGHMEIWYDEQLQDFWMPTTRECLDAFPEVLKRFNKKKEITMKTTVACGDDCYDWYRFDLKSRKLVYVGEGEGWEY